MAVAVVLIGVGLLVTGSLLVRAGKQRADAAVLVAAGRIGLGVGSVVTTIGLCWLVVAGL